MIVNQLLLVYSSCKLCKKEKLIYTHLFVTMKAISLLDTSTIVISEGKNMHVQEHTCILKTTVQFMHIVRELQNKVIPWHLVISYNLLKLRRTNNTIC